MSAEQKGRSKQRKRQNETHQTKQRDEAAAAQSADQPSAARWHERAAFHVAFDHTAGTEGQERWQTRAYHEESDDQAHWPVLARDRLLDWMWRKAELPGAASQSEPADEEIDVETTQIDLGLELDDIRLEEALAERQAGGPERTRGVIATVDFRLAGAHDQLPDLAPARAVAHLVACDLTSGALTVLATDQQRLSTETPDQRATVEFDLPSLGRYQLLAAILLPDTETIGVGVGPLLTVVP